MTQPAMIDPLIEVSITRMLKRIDFIVEKAEGPRHSREELRDGPRNKRGAFRSRIEHFVLKRPDLRNDQLANLIGVSGETIRVYRQRMKDEGRI